jgi:hypothetical protein
VPGTHGGSRRLPGGAEGIRTSDLRSVATHALAGTAASEPASTQVFGRNAQIADIGVEAERSARD